MYILRNTHTHNSASFCLNSLHIITHLSLAMGFPGGSVGKESACKSGDAGDVGSIPGWRRSPGGGHGNLLQYSCLENPMEFPPEEPGGLQSMGSKRVRHNWATKYSTQHSIEQKTLDLQCDCQKKFFFFNYSHKWDQRQAILSHRSWLVSFFFF